LLDVDGTLVDSGRLLPGAADLLAQLVAHRVPLALMTNSVRSPQTVRNELVAAGVELGEVVVLNPISVVNRLIQTQGIRRIWAIGTERETSQLLLPSTPDDPELIVLLDFEGPNADFRLLQSLQEFLTAGVPAVTASKSLYYKKNGSRRLDTGSFVALLEGASGGSITNLGKPDGAFFEAALGSLNARASETVILGDDGATDVVGGRSAGLATVLVKTGKYRAGDEDVFQPDLVVESLVDLAYEVLVRTSKKS
jgi:ribonucleotide monophosphatase NagD (HAD superfamily)